MNENTKNFLGIVIAFIAIAMVSLGIFSLVKIYVPELENMALFGDSFGFINTLFSGLALLIVSFSIMLQLKAFKLQQEELKLTREELKKAADAQVENQKILQKQVTIMANQSMISAYSDLASNRIEGVNGVLNARNLNEQGAVDKQFEINKEYRNKINPLIDQMEKELKEIEKPTD